MSNRANVTLQTVAILDAIDRLRLIQRTDVELIGAQKLEMMHNARQSLISLIDAYPFEDVLDLINETKGKVAA